MASRLEKLMFTVGLIDKASGPAGKIIAQLDQITARAQKGMQKIATGGAGLFAVGFGLKSMLAPTVEMDRALGELKSLDVADSALKTMEKTALRTSVQVGASAADIVRGAYDIQSAISGLTDNELAKFTQASAILAKGTKSDTGTITDYMGTMYGIFKNTADRMGKAEWVQQLTGQTATAVQMFKTTGVEMAGAFSRLGSAAESSGIKTAEQIAVLGKLQTTMSGSEAGTKYSQFLANVGKAQDKLGLKFTDSQNRMLPMVDILNRIKGKFGETLDESEKLDIRKAFGSQQAFDLITNLIGKTEELSGSITKLDSITGMDTATKMAGAIADPWERLGAAGTAVKTIFGRVLMPVLVPAAEWLIRMGDGVVNLTEKYPGLTKVIGLAVLTIVGLVAAFSLVSIVSGVAGVAMAGFQTVLVAVRLAALLFNAALWANPITWVVAGVIALVAAIAGLIIYWDKIRAAIEGNAILNFIFTPLMMAVDAVSWLIENFDKIQAWWQTFTTWLAGLNPFDVVGKGIDWLIDKINLIPGINIGANSAGAGLGGKEATGLNRQNAVPAGGLSQQINNQGTTVEKLEVNTTGGVSGYRLQDELMLAGG